MLVVGWSWNITQKRRKPPKRLEKHNDTSKGKTWKPWHNKTHEWALIPKEQCVFKCVCVWVWVWLRYYLGCVVSRFSLPGFLFSVCLSQLNVLSESHYPHMAKTRKIGEPSLEWLADQNYLKKTATIQRSQKTPKQKSKNCRPHLPLHHSTIRKRWGKNDLHGRVPRQKPLQSKRNIKTHLSFTRKHLDEPQDFWEKTLWTDKTKIELFGMCVLLHLA